MCAKLEVFLEKCIGDFEKNCVSVIGVDSQMNSHINRNVVNQFKRKQLDGEAKFQADAIFNRLGLPLISKHQTTLLPGTL